MDIDQIKAVITVPIGSQACSLHEPRLRRHCSSGISPLTQNGAPRLQRENLKSAAPIRSSTSEPKFRFALLLVVLSFGWNAIVPRALAAPASVSIAATDTAAAESGAAPSDTGTFAVSRPSSAKNDGNATVDFSISGAAGNGTDYRLRLPDGSYIADGATSGSLTILNGDTTAIIV